MQNYIPSRPRPVAVVMSDPSGLAISLVEILLGNFCDVYVATKKTSEWNDSIIHLKDNKNFQIILPSQLDDLKNINYIVCVNHVIGSNKKTVDRIKNEVSQAITFSSKNSVKAFLVLPYHQYSEQEKQVAGFCEEMFENHNENVGVVYVGDQIGPRVVLPLHRPFSKMIKDAVGDKEVKTPVNIKAFFPVDPTSTARQIAKSLFSFGGAGERKMIKGRDISPRDFARLLESLELSKIGEDVRVVKPDLPKRGVVERININLKKVLLDTISWFRANRLLTKDNKVKFSKPKDLSQSRTGVNKEKPGIKKLKEKDLSFKIGLGFGDVFSKSRISNVLVIVLILLLPYLFLFVTSTSLAISFNSFRKGNVSKTNSILSFSKHSINFTKNLSDIYSKVPVLGKAYSPVVNEVPINSMIFRIIESSTKVVDLGSVLVSNVFSQEEYDLLYFKNHISVSIDSIYKDLSFLESEINEGVLSKYIFKKYLEEEKLKETRNNLLLVKSGVDRLDSALGMVNPKKYLVLVQDNTELRATGGFIESILVLEFRNGSLYSLTFNNTDSVDTELKGTVDPPESLLRSLGEKDWFLRDSNWDSDFPTAAVQAEWFMDKETGEAFNGVFALNYGALKEMIEGNKITLESNRELIKENLYQQFHDDESLVEEFINEKTEQIAAMQSKDMIEFGKILINELSKKNIQLFFHDNKLQDLASELKWSGEVYQPVCFNNCYADYLGLVESNVGVNKVNEYIQRESFLEVNLDKGFLKKNLVLKITNNDQSGRVYKTYLRLLVPQDSKIQEAEIHKDNNVEYVKPFVEQVHGRKEAGVLVSVSEGKEVSVVFDWETLVNIDFARQGEYRMVWRKQSGTGEDPTSITFSIPNNIKPTFDQPFALTNGGIYRYNTTLARDFASRIFW